MSSPAVVSPAGIIHVLSYSPAEGEPGVPITVRIHFHPELADAMYVRLVVGHKAVATTVRELPGTVYGRWELTAVAPPLDADQHPALKVLVSVQALNDDNAVLDSVVFGEFSYWSPTCSPDHTIAPSRASPPEALPIRKRGATLSHVPSSAAERAAAVQPKLRIHRRLKAQSISRSKHSSVPCDYPKLVAQTPILELVTPLGNICHGWAQAEFAAGRRLVRFSKVQDGRKLIVSCEPIRQDDYCETDTVISCIYREDVDACFITSVDVIYLLERLTNGEFPVEEKNRIRRNLEGLRPTTVSKHKPGFGNFFQRIMEFPDPKPRNIEKDLKVFDWNLLGQALEKILSKYSIYVAPEEEGSFSSGSSVSDPSSLESPELAHLQLSYPAPSQDPVKFEPIATNLQHLPQNTNPSDVFVSPVDNTSPSPSVFPQFSTDTPETAHWHPGMKPNGLPSMDNLSVFEALDPLETVQGFTENTGMDFNIYDNFAFPGMGEENMVDHQYL